MPAMMDARSPVFDIAVVGAGAVGLALAAALKRDAGVKLKVALIDPAPRSGDGRLRTVALSPGSRALLERVGAWGSLQAEAEPIVEMAIYDGRRKTPCGSNNCASPIPTARRSRIWRSATT